MAYVMVWDPLLLVLWGVYIKLLFIGAGNESWLVVLPVNEWGPIRF